MLIFKLIILGVQIYLNLKKIIQNIVADVERSGPTPFIHIEAHGDIIDGLIFQNSSTLSWERVSKVANG